MKAIYDISAPAKLNLFLHVTGRRADGYHTLQSVFMLIDWCDTLHVERRADGQISREDIAATGDAISQKHEQAQARMLPALPAQDLSVRAAMALRQAGGAQAAGLGAHIGLVKRIPSQAGMGGGSSDAASTLLALNRLWGLNLPLASLLEIGLRLGADVPFFLRGSNAWVEGIGENITPVELPAERFLVVKPPDGLDTARIFSHPDLQRNTAPAIISGFAANPFQFGRNDLQREAQTLCPGVGQGLKWLEQQGLQGRMTGSGSAVFAHLPGIVSGGAVESHLLVNELPEQLVKESPKDLTEASVGVPPEAPTGFVVRTCSNLPSHPLAGWADS
jgi:4-diphosphocytidyl-2-C-methyl-D-erythritol kinase